MKTCKPFWDLGDIPVKHPPPLLKRQKSCTAAWFLHGLQVLEGIPDAAHTGLYTVIKASSQSIQLCRVHNQKPGSHENWSLWGPCPVLGTALGFDPCNVLQQEILLQQLSNKLNTNSCYASIQSFLHLRKKYLN